MNRLISIGWIAAALLLVSTGPGFAEAVNGVPPVKTVTTTTIDYGQAFGWLQPYVISFAGALITAAGAWVTYLVQKWTGLKIDQTLSQGYILNAQNQASALIAKGFVIIRENGKVDIQSHALAEAANDLLKAVPDAAARFELKPSEVAEKIVAMVPQVPAAPVVIAGTAKKP